MVYILDDYFAMNHEQYCRVVRSNMETSDLIQIVSAITFLFEDTVAPAANLDIKCLTKILGFFDAEDITDSFKEEAIKQISLPPNGIFEKQQVNWNKEMITVTAIDLFAARESCCGPQYADLIDRWLKKDITSIKKILMEEGMEI